MNELCRDGEAAGRASTPADATTDADTIPPTELCGRVQDVIAAHIDQENWHRQQTIEAAELETVEQAVKSWEV